MQDGEKQALLLNNSLNMIDDFCIKILKEYKKNADIFL